MSNKSCLEVQSNHLKSAIASCNHIFGPAYFFHFQSSVWLQQCWLFCSKYLQQVGYFLHNLGSQQVGATGCVGPLNHIYCRSLEEFEIACNQRWADCVGGLFKTICSRTNEQINKQTNNRTLIKGGTSLGLKTSAKLWERRERGEREERERREREREGERRGECDAT